MDYPALNQFLPQFSHSYQTNGHPTMESLSPNDYTQLLPLSSYDESWCLPSQTLQPYDVTAMSHQGGFTEAPMSLQLDPAPTATVIQSHQLPVPDGTNDVHVQPMAPPPNPRKRKAPTLRLDEWEPVKARVIELHITQNLPLPEVKKMVEEEFKSSGFTATIRQYRSRLTQWGLDKNVKPNEMKAIVRKRQQRRLAETDKGDLVFTVRGNVVESGKIDRWMKRNGVTESMLYAPSPAASTPAALNAWTISERGSPAQSPTGLLSSPASAMSPFASPGQYPSVYSPAPSLSSVIMPSSNAFIGQSPALSYRSISALALQPNSQLHIPESQLQLSPNDHHAALVEYRYRRVDEDRLRHELSLRETQLGGEHSETLHLLQELAKVLMDQGRYRSAEVTARKLVMWSQKQYGIDHSRTLEALDQLGQVLLREGLYGKAENLFQRTFEARRKVLGEEHPSTLFSVNSLGLVLGRQAKYEEAEAMHRRALEGNEKVLGPEHPETLASFDNLGIVLEGQGKYEEAEAMHRRSLEGNEKALGPEHPSTLTGFNNLGLVLRRQGKYEEAEAVHRPAVEASEKVLGSEHPDTLISVNNLGLALSRQGKYEEAEAMHQRAIKGLEKVLGPEHPGTLISVNNLGFALSEQGKYEEAEAMHRRAIEAREKVLGLEHPDTLTSFNDLSSVLSRQGKYEEAEAMRRRAIKA